MKVTLTAHNLPGRILAVCGTDGTGKSTAIRIISEQLAKFGISSDEIVYLTQPSDWWRSDLRVQRTILHEGQGEIADELAIGVFAIADRLNQQSKIIAPALQAGKTILLDRYVFSMVSYYMAHNEPELHYLTSICKPIFEPDLALVMDCPAEIAIDRVVKRDGSRPEKYDQRIEITTRIIQTFRELAESNGLELVSSLQSQEAMSTQIQAALRKAIR